ncbi:hypothetical protein NPIL_187181 [Nephila pilipes]|uniref:Uncharacterized protein n=1 Tax=Nephila pilipes TaxID=299642 RepID=A0A8X6P845_NEPPI|nr:hypothetical protein NPIL_187181 [Nephila pilipes]
MRQSLSEHGSFIVSVHDTAKTLMNNRVGRGCFGCSKVSHICFGEHSLQCQESHEASHCDVNRCYGNRPRWMTGRVPGGRDLSRTLAPADWLCRNVTGYALFECSTVILRTEVS